ncbi:MAG: serine/threonine protein kinase, partial [Myxococcales bacterium]|nr:serine/threonine protein kinase [Myxococcales bacterium]
MADAPSLPHPAFVPPPLLGGDDDADDLRQRIAARSDFTRRYQRQRLLASGQMSSLHLCRDHLIGRAIALKTLTADRQGRREAELRFLREAAIQGQLEHPAIVPVYDLGVDPEGSIYFTMKRIRGITLDEIIDSLAWDRPGFRAEYTRHRLLRALASVCLAVDFAHRRGIVHRDLKPSNIMLGDFGEVYVLDWGLARIDPTLADEAETSSRTPAAAYYALRTLPGALLGTPGYMAPEQLGAAEEVGPAADVYALGAILFEVLAGSRLHDHEEPADRVRSTIQGIRARPSERAPELAIGPELDAICERATALHPDARYPGARELFDALDRFLAGERDHELRRELADRHVAAGLAADEGDADD